VTRADLPPNIRLVWDRDRHRPPPLPSEIAGDPFRLADYALDYRDTLLSAWEVDYCRRVGSRAARGGAVTAKERAILREIAETCRLYGAGGRHA
jgi:hypothetical protein